jgi:hypothetical protein
MNKRGCKLSGERGSITLETAIALVAYISAVLTVSLFIRVAYVQGVVQHALIQTANEMATYSYIYSLTGANEINGALVDRKLTNDKDVSGAIDSVTNVYDEFTAGKYGDAASDASDLKSLDIKALLQSFCTSSIGEVYEVGKTTGFNLVTKALMKTYLPNDLDKFFKIGMFADTDSDFPIDLSYSTYFSNSDKDEIQLVAAYDLKLVSPIPIIDRNISIAQTAKARAWLASWKGSGASSDDTSTSSVWELSDFDRAEKIASTNSALNLQKDFKCIRGFNQSNGTASLYITMDIRNDSYTGKKSAMKSQIKSKLNNLEDYKSYSLAGTTVKAEDIKAVDYYVYIPKDASEDDKAKLREAASDLANENITTHDGRKIKPNIIVQEVQ